VQDCENTFEVITDGRVGDAIVVHDLDAPELVIGGIHFSTKDLKK
jgi:hypothetical protein